MGARLCWYGSSPCNQLQAKLAEWSHVEAIWQQYSDDSRMTCHHDDRGMSAAASTHCQPHHCFCQQHHQHTHALTSISMSSTVFYICIMQCTMGHITYVLNLLDFLILTGGLPPYSVTPPTGTAYRLAWQQHQQQQQRDWIWPSTHYR